MYRWSCKEKVFIVSKIFIINLIPKTDITVVLKSNIFITIWKLQVARTTICLATYKDNVWLRNRQMLSTYVSR